MYDFDCSYVFYKVLFYFNEFLDCVRGFIENSIKVCLRSLKSIF